MKYASPLLLLFIASVASAAATLVITPTGYYQLALNSQGVPELTKFDEVLRMSDDPDPTDPPPDPVTLDEKVQAWATEVNEPKSAEAQGLMMNLIAEQGARGTFATKARMAAFTKEAIPKTLETAGSTKVDEWLAVWDDKIWPEVRKMEAAGQMNTITEQVGIWEDIAVGFKGTVQATWAVQFSTVDGSTTLVIKGEAGDRPFLEMLMKLLLQLLLDWLGNNPLGQSV